MANLTPFNDVLIKAKEKDINHASFNFWSISGPHFYHFTRLVELIFSVSQILSLSNKVFSEFI